MNIIFTSLGEILRAWINQLYTEFPLDFYQLSKLLSKVVGLLNILTSDTHYCMYIYYIQGMKCNSQFSESFCAYGPLLTCLLLLWRCCFSSLEGVFVRLFKYSSITSQSGVTVTNACQNLSTVFLYLWRQSIGFGILLVK